MRAHDPYFVGTVPMVEAGKQMLYVEDTSTSHTTWVELSNDQARRLAHRILSHVPAA